MPKEIETRSAGELRTIHDDGSFEGYLTVWDTVDDYNSTFKRGAFKKTIQERGSRVKIFYDHEHLIGSSVELREDDHGVFGKGQLNLDVEKAKEAYSFMKDGTLDGLSFGFRTIKEGFDAGIRVIKEVALYEFGPVTFPANDAALITGVRAADFDESFTETQLITESDAIRWALNDTLSDIWFSDESNSANIIGLLDEALSKHHAAYLEFAQRWINQFFINNRCSPDANELSKSFIAFALEQRKTLDEIAADTSLTKTELKHLKRGSLIESRDKLTELPESIRQAHQEQRSKAVETLCAELRDGLTDAEKRRVKALLEPVETQSEPDLSVVSYLAKFRKELNG